MYICNIINRQQYNMQQQQYGNAQRYNNGGQNRMMNSQQQFNGGGVSLDLVLPALDVDMRCLTLPLRNAHIFC